MIRLILCILLTAIIPLAKAVDIFKCKKHNKLYPDSYKWVEMSKENDEHFKFLFGTGIESQMLEVYFDSEVDQLDESHFYHKENTFELDVIKLKNQLSFTIISGAKKLKYNHFLCE